MKLGMLAARMLAMGIVGLFQLSVPSGAAVHTNPMNYDPQVRAAYERFYNLDYPGAVARLRDSFTRPIPAIRRRQLTW